ncbi:hypothetical protein BHE74_00023112 [Ensete ventricosum]|nr:hypothetical protein BHE74_00023112 [Ensete ventricosum]
MALSLLLQESQDVRLERVLKAAATEDNTVILTSLNAFWSSPGSVLDLFLESFRIGDGTSELLSHLVIVAVDDKAYERCLAVHPHCFHLKTEGVDYSGEKVFNTPEYLDMMWARLDFLRLILEKGYNFIFSVSLLSLLSQPWRLILNPLNVPYSNWLQLYLQVGPHPTSLITKQVVETTSSEHLHGLLILQDVDIMWFRNPLLYFYPDGDFQTSCDNFLGDPTNLKNWPNNGFNYVKSNNRSIEFYKYWYTSRARFPGVHEQNVLNIIKFDQHIKQIGVTIRFLSTERFGGFCEPSRDLNKNGPVELSYEDKRSVCTSHISIMETTIQMH